MYDEGINGKLLMYEYVLNTLWFRFQHANVYRSRSAGTSGESGELRARERDPLHRSHTNLELRQADST